MKRYLVFTGEFYYPSGGWEDFKGSTDDLDEARVVMTLRRDSGETWAHIVDTKTMKIVAMEPRPPSTPPNAPDGYDQCVECGDRFNARPEDDAPLCPHCRAKHVEFRP